MFSPILCVQNIEYSKCRKRFLWNTRHASILFYSVSMFFIFSSNDAFSKGDKDTHPFLKQSDNSREGEWSHAREQLFFLLHEQSIHRKRIQVAASHYRGFTVAVRRLLQQQNNAKKTVVKDSYLCSIHSKIQKLPSTRSMSCKKDFLSRDIQRLQQGLKRKKRCLVNTMESLVLSAPDIKGDLSILKKVQSDQLIREQSLRRLQVDSVLQVASEIQEGGEVILEPSLYEHGIITCKLFGQQLRRLEHTIKVTKKLIRRMKKENQQETEQVEKKEEELKALMMLLESYSQCSSGGSPSDPPPPPPPSGSATGIFSGSMGQCSAFIPEYNSQENICSLIELQNVLRNTSKQISTFLQTLSLHALRFQSKKTVNPLIATESTNTTETKTYSNYSLLKGRTKKNSEPKNENVTFPSLYNMFYSLDKYNVNMEEKCRSAQLGFISYSVEKTIIGFAYDYSFNKVTKDREMVVGSTKATTNTHMLSSIMTYNTNEKGLTGQLATCYGWGKINTTRYVIPVERHIGIKGAPNIKLGGALAWVGYNFFLSPSMRFTPYLEGVVTKVVRNAYCETVGNLSSKVSSHNEQVVETNVGLWYSYDMVSKAHLHTWTAVILGNHLIDKLTYSPLIESVSSKLVLPKNRKKYTYTEFGIAYEVKPQEVCTVSINGEIRFSKTQKPDDGSMKLFVTYYF